MSDTAVETPIAESAVEFETIYAPATKGIDAELLLLPAKDGWCGGARARLPEASYDCPPQATDLARPSRESALVVACEDLIAWCGEQKEKGGKRHRKEAAALQEWALAEERKAAPADGDAATGTADDLIPAAEVEAMRAELQTAATPGAQQLAVEWIPIEDIYESPWNPRQIYPVKEMGELVESMRAGGFRPWQPLVARPIGETSEVWRTVAATSRRCVELGAGHRRRRAALLAGLTMVPVVVREMTDEEFLKLLNFDNSGREDVHPLHEAAGWRVLMERTGMGVNDIAAQIGQSKEYVYQRLKYADLIDEGRVAFLDGKITAGHAILIARLEPKAQVKALKFATAADWRGNVPGVRALADHLHQEEYVDLGDDCAFDRTDRTLLSGASACDDCPKRAANIPGFDFGDRAEGVDLCTDRVCHSQKTTNHLVRVKAEIRERIGGDVIEVSETYSTRKKGVLNNLQYEVVKKADAKADPNVKAALVVEGRDVGKVIHVRVRREEPKPKQVTQAERDAAQKKQEAEVERELGIRRAILAAVTERVGGLTRADVEAFLLAEIARSSYGSLNCDELCRLHGIEFNPHQAHFALASALPKLREAEFMCLVVEASVIQELRSYNPGEPVKLLALAKRYKVDAAKIRREMEESAKEAEGGTRREVIKKLPTLNQAKKSAPAKRTAPKKATAKPAAKKAGKGKK
jgi:ParB/RepB/Spo0J family partition protein